MYPVSAKTPKAVPPNLPGVIFTPGRTGRRGPVTAIAGKHTVPAAARLTGVDRFTIRLWAEAFGHGVGCRFQPRGPVFINLHVVETIGCLRDARGALPRYSCEPGSARHRVVMLAAYAAIRAKGVPLPDDLIAEYRRRLDLPPYPQRRSPPAVPEAQPAEARHVQA
jgi:hypothetical protein